MALSRTVVGTYASADTVNLSSGYGGVFICVNAYSDILTSLSLGGQSYTRVGNADPASFPKATIWYREAPTGGTGLSFSTSHGFHRATVIGYTGLDTANPYDTAVEFNYDELAAFNQTVSSETGDEVLVCSGHYWNEAYNATGDLIELVEVIDSGVGLGYNHLIGYAPGATTVSVGWSSTQATEYSANVAININVGIDTATVNYIISPTAQNTVRFPGQNRTIIKK